MAAKIGGDPENKPIKRFPAKPVTNKTGKHTSKSRSVRKDGTRGGLGERA